MTVQEVSDKTQKALVPSVAKVNPNPLWELESKLDDFV